MTLSNIAAALAVSLALSVAGAARAEDPIKEEKPGLPAKAKVKPSTARAAALAKVPNAVVKSQEIENEHGKLVYSFDLAVPGKTGIEEVVVDATTGKVLSVEHEDPAKEAAEEKDADKDDEKDGKKQ